MESKYSIVAVRQSPLDNYIWDESETFANDLLEVHNVAGSQKNK